MEGHNFFSSNVWISFSHGTGTRLYLMKRAKRSGNLREAISQSPFLSPSLSSSLDWWTLYTLTWKYAIKICRIREEVSCPRAYRFVTRNMKVSRFTLLNCPHNSFLATLANNSTLPPFYVYSYDSFTFLNWRTLVGSRGARLALWIFVMSGIVSVVWSSSNCRVCNENVGLPSREDRASIDYSIHSQYTSTYILPVIAPQANCQEVAGARSFLRIVVPSDYKGIIRRSVHPEREEIEYQRFITS